MYCEKRAKCYALNKCWFQVICIIACICAKPLPGIVRSKYMYYQIAFVKLKLLKPHSWGILLFGTVLLRETKGTGWSNGWFFQLLLFKRPKLFSSGNKLNLFVRFYIHLIFWSYLFKIPSYLLSLELFLLLL